MKAFMILALAALAHARPEPPSGYNYQRPQVISQQYSGPSFNIDSSQSHQSSVAFRPELQVNTGFSGSSQGFSGSAQGFSGSAQGFSGSAQGFSGSTSGFSGSASGGGVSFVQQQPQLAPIIQKHIYVHVPPPEPIEEQKHFVSQALAPRKNYKIIFIKAPSAPAISQQILQQQQEVQEKTIVYVLVKKPDEQEALTLAGFAPTKPSKPEVYFIKYKTQKDAAGGIGASASGNAGFSSGASLSSSGGFGASGSGNGGFSSGLNLATSGGFSATGSGNSGFSSGLNLGSASSIGSSIATSSSSGSSHSVVSGGSPSANYGPPGSSGPY